MVHVEADPARVSAIDVDGLSYRGMLRLLAGELKPAIGDLGASLALARKGATLTLGKGMSNPEIAAELYISRKAVEYHLGNVYAKSGLRGRQQLRRFVEQWHQPTAV